MASLNHIFFGILIFQIYVQAAPDVSKIEDIAKVEKPDDKLDPTSKDHEDTIPTETPRRKRYFNPYGFGGPPNFQNYPGFSRGNDYTDPAIHGADPLVEIHKRVQEIANIIRQPSLPPTIAPVSHFPVFLPVLYVPPTNCACNQNNQNTGQTPSTTNDQNLPDIVNRVSSMEDERQNWGLLINDTTVRQAGQDNSRPISFEPIKPLRPQTRPPPPVDHGSQQGILADTQNQFNGVGTPQTPSGFTAAYDPGTQTTPRPPQNSISVVSSGGLPTRCDGAILMCCHQAQVAYDCFSSQGCSSLFMSGNPCTVDNIYAVVEKYQRLYVNKSG